MTTFTIFYDDEPLIKAVQFCKSMKQDLGSWRGLPIIALGKRNGKIVGYDSKNQPIYASSPKAKKLAAIKQQDAKDKVDSVGEWLLALGIPNQIKAGALFVQPKSAQLLKDHFGVTGKKVGGAVRFSFGDLLEHAGEPLVPKEEQQTGWAATMASGEMEEDPFPDLATLKEIPPGKFAGSGYHGINRLFVDPKGQKFVFKDQHMLIARGEEAAARVGRLIMGDKIPPVRMVEINGKPGALIKVVPGEMMTETNHSNPPGKLLDKHRKDIARHFVVDWLVSNHDAHGGNFLTDGDDLIGIDKGQAWKFFGKDPLDPNYSPNEHDTIYRKFWNAVAKGTIGLDTILDAMGEALDAAETISVDQFKSIVAPYVSEAAGDKFDPNVRADQMAARLTNLRSDMEGYLSKLMGKPVQIPKKHADNFETMPEVEAAKEGAPALTINVPDKPKVIEGGPKEAIQTKQAAGWPATKGQVTINHPGEPSPGGKWPKGYPGPGFSSSVKYKKQNYAIEFKAGPGGNLQVDVYYPDGTLKTWSTPNSAYESMMLYHQGLPWTLSSKEKQAKGIGGSAKKAFGLQAFKHELAQAHAGVLAPAEMNPKELEDAGIVAKGAPELTVEAVMAKTPDGVLSDWDDLPHQIQEAMLANDFEIGKDYPAAIVPGWAYKTTEEGGPVVYFPKKPDVPGVIEYHVFEWENGKLVQGLMHSGSVDTIYKLDTNAELQSIKKGVIQNLPQTVDEQIGAAPKAEIPKDAVVPPDAPKEYDGPLPPGTSHTVKKKFPWGKGDVMLLAHKDGFDAAFFDADGNMQTQTFKSLSAACDWVWVNQKGYPDAVTYKKEKATNKIPSGGGWGFWGLKTKPKPKPSEKIPKMPDGKPGLESLDAFPPDYALSAYPVGTTIIWNHEDGSAWKVKKVTTAGGETMWAFYAPGAAPAVIPQEAITNSSTSKLAKNVKIKVPEVAPPPPPPPEPAPPVVGKPPAKVTSIPAEKDAVTNAINGMQTWDTLTWYESTDDITITATKEPDGLFTLWDAENGSIIVKNYSAASVLGGGIDGISWDVATDFKLVTKSAPTVESAKPAESNWETMPDVPVDTELDKMAVGSVLRFTSSTLGPVSTYTAEKLPYGKWKIVTPEEEKVGASSYLETIIQLAKENMQAEGLAFSLEKQVLEAPVAPPSAEGYADPFEGMPTKWTSVTVNITNLFLKNQVEGTQLKIDGVVWIKTAGGVADWVNTSTGETRTHETFLDFASVKTDVGMRTVDSAKLVAQEAAVEKVAPVPAGAKPVEVKSADQALSYFKDMEPGDSLSWTEEFGSYKLVKEEDGTYTLYNYAESDVISNVIIEGAAQAIDFESADGFMLMSTAPKVESTPEEFKSIPAVQADVEAAIQKMKSGDELIWSEGKKSYKLLKKPDGKYKLADWDDGTVIYESLKPTEANSMVVWEQEPTSFELYSAAPAPPPSPVPAGKPKVESVTLNQDSIKEALAGMKPGDVFTWMEEGERYQFTVNKFGGYEGLNIGDQYKFLENGTLSESVKKVDTVVAKKGQLTTAPEAPAAPIEPSWANKTVMPGEPELEAHGTGTKIRFWDDTGNTVDQAEKKADGSWWLDQAQMHVSAGTLAEILNETTEYKAGVAYQLWEIPSESNWETMPEQDSDSAYASQLNDLPIGAQLKMVSKGTGKTWTAVKDYLTHYTITGPTGNEVEKGEVGMAAFLTNMKNIQVKGKPTPITPDVVSQVAKVMATGETIVDVPPNVQDVEAALDGMVAGQELTWEELGVAYKVTATDEGFTAVEVDSGMVLAVDVPAYEVKDNISWSSDPSDFKLKVPADMAPSQNVKTVTVSVEEAVIADMKEKWGSKFSRKKSNKPNHTNIFVKDKGAGEAALTELADKFGLTITNKLGKPKWLYGSWYITVPNHELGKTTTLEVPADGPVPESTQPSPSLAEEKEEAKWAAVGAIGGKASKLIDMGFQFKWPEDVLPDDNVVEAAGPMAGTAAAKIEAKGLKLVKGKKPKPKPELSPDQKAKIEKAKEVAEWLKNTPPVPGGKAPLVLAHFQALFEFHKSGMKAWARSGGKGKLLLGSPNAEFANLMADMEKTQGLKTKKVDTPLGTFWEVKTADLAKAIPGQPAGTVKGPDGKTYPKGTTWTKEVIPYTNEQLLADEPAFYKITEHKTDPKLKVVKVQGTDDTKKQQLLDMVKKHGLTHEEPVQGGYNWLTFVPTAELEKVGKEETQYNAEVPPQPSPFSSAPYPTLGTVKGGQPGISNRADLAAIGAIKIGMTGHSVRMGAPGVFRNGQVYVRKVKDENGQIHYEVHGELEKFDVGKSSLEPASYLPMPSAMKGDSNVHNFEDGVHIESGKTIYNSNGYKGETANGSEVRIYGGDYTALRNTFAVRIPEGADLEAELGEALGAIGLDAAAAMREHTPEDERILIKSAIVKNKIGPLAWRKLVSNKNFPPGKRYNEAWLDSQLKALGVSPEVVASARFETTIANHQSVVVDDPMIDNAKSVEYVYIGMGGTSMFNQLMDGSGWCARTHYAMNGQVYGGASPGSDLTSGGANSSFCRIGYAGHDESDSWGLGCGGWKVVLHKRILKRTNWRFYTSDSYGTTSESVGAMKPKEGVTGPMSASNEICFDVGIGAQDVAGIMAPSESEKQSMIAKFKAKGIEEYNGIPLDDFIQVVTGSSRSKAAKKFVGLKPGVLS